MSSDEKDPNDDRYYHTIRPYWRNEQVTHWLHNLDRIHLKKHDPGSKLANHRRSSAKVDMNCEVVKGLPLNFYDGNYLDSLERSQYEGLDLQPSISLGFGHSIERYALTFWSGSHLTGLQPFGRECVNDTHSCCADIVRLVNVAGNTERIRRRQGHRWVFENFSPDAQVNHALSSPVLAKKNTFNLCESDNCLLKQMHLPMRIASAAGPKFSSINTFDLMDLFCFFTSTSTS